MTNQIRVAILGSKGRMGKSVCASVDSDPECVVVAQLDVEDSLDQLITSRASVVVDFTHPDSVMDNVAFAVKHGIDIIVGTSGITPDRLEQISLWVSQRGNARVLIVPNFSIGAVLAIQFSERAAKFFPSVEIIELHHPLKVDAPSGTARYTAERISRARHDLPPAPDNTAESDAVARGIPVAGIPIHSLRISGLTAHQEVILGGEGETLTIRHDSLSRESFMPESSLRSRKSNTPPVSHSVLITSLI